MSITELRDEFEASTSPIATFAGSVIGPLLVLAAVTALAVFAERWFAWASVALGVVVLLATLYTLYEVISTVSLCRQSAGRSSALYVLASKVFELVFFIAASFFLFSGHY
jgi:hypothetical protein